jgi:hypothetical protein
MIKYVYENWEKKNTKKLPIDFLYPIYKCDLFSKRGFFKPCFAGQKQML